MLVDSLTVTEEFLDVLVVVQAASLKACAEKIVDAGRHLVLDFMSQGDQESQIVCGIFVNGRSRAIQASFQFPVLVGSLACCVKLLPPAWEFVEISVINFLLAIMGMKKIRPSDHHQHNVDLGFECNGWIIKNLNGRQGGLPRFLDEFKFYRLDETFALDGHQINPLPSVVEAID